MPNSQQGCSSSDFPPAHHSSSQIKSIPNLFLSFPSSALLSSAQPRRKLVKQFIASARNIMSNGRVGKAGASRHTGLCIPRGSAPPGCWGWPQTPRLEVAIHCSRCYGAARVPEQVNFVIALPPAGREQELGENKNKKKAEECLRAG